jgi:hypothetical protein
LKRLMLDHAFQFVESVVFLIGPTNIRSQKAVEKIGGVLRGRQEKTLKGKPVEQVVYKLKEPMRQYWVHFEIEWRSCPFQNRARTGVSGGAVPLGWWMRRSLTQLRQDNIRNWHRL